MRATAFVFTAVFLLAPAGAHSQTHRGGAPGVQPPPRVAAPPVRATVPAPPITYPFPPLMPPPAGGLTPPAGGLPPRVNNAYRPNRRNQPFLPYGSGYGGYGYGVAEDLPAGSDRMAAPAEPPSGLLRLAVTPSSAQVFVDSLYVGTVEDVEAQRVLRLEAGPHRVEFRAPDYRPLTVDIRVTALETITYRGVLEPLRPQAAPAAPAAQATVMYVIPNCYVGNLPPRQNRLPSGCNAKDVQVLKPTASAPR